MRNFSSMDYNLKGEREEAVFIFWSRVTTSKKKTQPTRRINDGNVQKEGFDMMIEGENKVFPDIVYTRKREKNWPLTGWSSKP